MIPLYNERELKNLFEAQSRLCFDRSRSIEKILKYYGYEVRHVFLFSTVNTNSSIKSLFTPDIKSHGISEVLTQEGWIAIDLNSPWQSINQNGNVFSIKKIQRKNHLKNKISWMNKPLHSLYNSSFSIFYGLYSRHGKFYPLYTFYPDINLGEFLYNFNLSE